MQDRPKAMPAHVSHEERNLPNISAFFAENILATSDIEKDNLMFYQSSGIIKPFP